MAKIDGIKEELKTLKVLLVIVVITMLGLTSWLMDNYVASVTLNIVIGIAIFLLIIADFL